MNLAIARRPKLAGSASLALQARATVALAALVASAAACGASTVASSGGAGAGGGGAPGASCPAALPAGSGPCATPGLVCAFGSDPRPDCRPTATCAASAWAVNDPRCSPLPAVTCPPSLAAAQGTSCSPSGAYCSYDAGLSCQCTDCPNPYPICQLVPLQWACESANQQPHCPAAIPNQGTACAPAGTVCSYGCQRGRARTCEGGVWVAGSTPGGCPLSTRAAKTDIRYLEATEREALAAQVSRMRLATYEYVDRARAGQRHLGFILEDNPVPFGEDAEHSQVDLYGYASTLAAAVQVQGERLEALEAEVVALRDERARAGRACLPR